MKKLFSLLVIAPVFAILFASCAKKSTATNPINTDTIVVNKPDTVPANTLIATIDDTVYTFNKVTRDTSASAPGTNLILIEAVDVDSNQIVLLFISKNPITNITYGSTGDTTNEVAIAMTYYTSSYWASAFPATESNPATVTVTSISSSSIKGTLKGYIYLDGDSTAAYKPITNGKFNFNL